MKRPPKRRVRDTAQRSLFSSAPSEERGRGGRGDPRFVAMDRSKLFVGDEPLDVYLARSGKSEVLELARLIEQIDVEPFRARYQGTGRAPHHPHAILGLLAYGADKGLSSLRELENLAIVDVGAWWLCAGHQPDHSALGRFLKLHEDLLQDPMFVEATKIVVKATGAPTTGSVAMDGTTVQAASSTFRTRTAERLASDLMEARSAAETDGDDTNRALVEKLERATEFAEERVKARREHGKGGTVRVSPDEPEAVNQPLKNGLHRPSFKPTLATSANGFIVGQTVVPSHEGSALPALIDQSTSCLGHAPQRLLLDAGFHSGAVLKLCFERDIDVLCPSEREPKSDDKLFKKQLFVYDDDDDTYSCPAGETLRRESTRSETRGGRVVVYACRAARTCALRDRCTRSPDRRRIKRYENEDLKQAMAAIMRDKRAQAAYAKRSPIAETPFAQIKRNQGLERFRRRGLSGARLELSIHCFAFNMAKGARLMAALVLLRVDGELAFATLVLAR